jgi:hypothetical protein
MIPIYQQRLSSRGTSNAAATIRQAVCAVMLPFEVLHRHHWSAPWDEAQR